MDLNATQDICQIDAGFTCTAMFPANMLDPSTVKTNGITEINIGGQIRDVVRVRLEVMLHDIWFIAEFIDGTQHILFIDAEALKKVRWIPSLLLHLLRATQDFTPATLIMSRVDKSRAITWPFAILRDFKCLAC